MGLLKADVVVIGGGAAGSMCALTAAQRGLHVVLLEPNKMLGKKLRITGKGRCNVTNHCDVKTILANIPGDGRFLYSALNRLGPQDTMALFESLGVPLKTERGNRVFPVSDRSHDVANALERAYAHAGGKVVHAAATDILTQDGAVSAVVTTEGADRLRCRRHLHGRPVLSAHRFDRRRLPVCAAAGPYGHAHARLARAAGIRGSLVRRDAGLLPAQRDAHGLR